MGTRKAIILLAAIAAAGCVSSEPILIGATFAPQGGIRWQTRAVNGQPACRLALATVRDGRGDSEFMGMLGNRVVRARDSAAWVRTGFESLKADARILLVEPGDPVAQVSLDVELLKANVASVNMAKTANVAVRVRYQSASGVASEKMLRGENADVNWNNGDNEAVDALNSALAEIVAVAHADVLASCAADSHKN